MMLHSSHCADVPRVAPGLLPKPRLTPHLRPLPRLLQDGAQLRVLTLGVHGLVPDIHQYHHIIIHYYSLTGFTRTSQQECVREDV